MGRRDARHNLSVTNVIPPKVTPDTDRPSYVAQNWLTERLFRDGKGVKPYGDEEGIPQEACVG